MEQLLTLENKMECEKGKIITVYILLSSAVKCLHRHNIVNTDYWSNEIKI